MTKADIQLVRALADKRGRTEHGLFVAEGEKLIGELRASHLSVRRIFSLEGVFNGPEVETVAPRDMERLSLLKTPSNSLALVEIPRCDLKPERLRGRLTLALDDVQNPETWARSSGWPTGSASRTSSAPKPRPTVSTPRSYKPRWGRSSA